MSGPGSDFGAGVFTMTGSIARPAISQVAAPVHAGALARTLAQPGYGEVGAKSQAATRPGGALSAHGVFGDARGQAPSHNAWQAAMAAMARAQQQPGHVEQRHDARPPVFRPEPRHVLQTRMVSAPAAATLPTPPHVAAAALAMAQPGMAGAGSAPSLLTQQAGAAHVSPQAHMAMLQQLALQHSLALQHARMRQQQQQQQQQQLPGQGALHWQQAQQQQQAQQLPWGSAWAMPTARMPPGAALAGALQQQLAAAQPAASNPHMRAPAPWGVEAAHPAHALGMLGFAAPMLAFHGAAAANVHPAVARAPAAEGPWEQRMIGGYTREQRRERIKRWLEKRKRRVNPTKIRYLVRSKFANNRPRTRGRFVPVDQLTASESEPAAGDAKSDAQEGGAGQAKGRKAEPAKPKARKPPLAPPVDDDSSISPSSRGSSDSQAGSVASSQDDERMRAAKKRRHGDSSSDTGMDGSSGSDSGGGTGRDSGSGSNNSESDSGGQSPSDAGTKKRRVGHHVDSDAESGSGSSNGSSNGTDSPTGDAGDDDDDEQDVGMGASKAAAARQPGRRGLQNGMQTGKHPRSQRHR